MHLEDNKGINLKRDVTDKQTNKNPGHFWPSTIRTVLQTDHLTTLPSRFVTPGLPYPRLYIIVARSNMTYSSTAQPYLRHLPLPQLHHHHHHHHDDLQLCENNVAAMLSGRSPIFDDETSQSRHARWKMQGVCGGTRRQAGDNDQQQQQGIHHQVPTYVFHA